MSQPHVILLQPEAPPQPAPGQPCNGCGVCCTWQPCPIGMLAGRTLRGPCTLLRWQPDEARYRCGAVGDGRGWRAALARRWIAAGQGCDCTLQAKPDAG